MLVKQYFILFNVSYVVYYLLVKSREKVIKNAIKFSIFPSLKVQMKHFLFTLLIIISFTSFSQNGGDNTYEFLNVPVSARVGALGGTAIAIKDGDANLGLNNPSLLSPDMHSTVSLTYLNYFADINYGFVSYTNDFKKLGTFSAGLKYISYGKFTESDEGGNELGEFSAGEYAMVLGWGKSIDTSFSVGANLKPVYSNLYTYNSFGLAADAAATYYFHKREVVTALIVKNVGAQITTYVEGGEREPLPFEVQFGISKKLKYVPLRLSLTLNNLENWNLAYNDSTYLTNSNNNLTDEEKDERNKSGLFKEAIRHVVLGAEIVPSKSFNLRFGFNFKRRAELAIEEKPGLVGFSWGVGFRIKRFHISYGSARYHLAGSSNHITISTSISESYKKATVSSQKTKKTKAPKAIKSKKGKEE